jgi:PAS domain S-box-containing protein
MSAAKQVKLDRTRETVDQLLAVAPNATVIMGENCRVVRVNSEAEKLFGYSQDQLLGQKPDFLVPGLRRERKHRTGRGGPPHIRPIGYGLETVVRRRDGTEFPAVVNLALLEVGGNTLISSVFREIPNVPGQELDLRALVDASDDAIIGKTLDGTILSWNKGAEKIFGYTAEKILGQPISVLVPPGHPNELPEIMVRLRRGEHIEKFETTRIHKDGHLIDVSVTISPVKSKDGMVVGACVVARDITPERQLQQALRLSEERFRVALKNAPVVVCSQDPQLHYTWINSPVVGWHHHNYLGRTDAEILGGEDGARLTAIKEEVIRTGIGSHTEIIITIRGAKHYFDLVVEPLRNARGELLGLFSSAIDTTTLKETIFKLHEALNQVQMLSGLLTICASCKRIRDEHEMWQPLEGYIQAHSEAKFTYGVCPDCLRKLYPEYYPESPGAR